MPCVVDVLKLDNDDEDVNVILVTLLLELMDDISKLLELRDMNLVVVIRGCDEVAIEDSKGEEVPSDTVLIDAVVVVKIDCTDMVVNVGTCTRLVVNKGSVVEVLNVSDVVEKLGSKVVVNTSFGVVVNKDSSVVERRASVNVVNNSCWVVEKKEVVVNKG